MRKPQRIFTTDFKQQAVQLATTPGQTASSVARDLGVSAQAVNRWVREYKTAQDHGRPFAPGRGIVALSEQEKRIKELERENAILKQEREILKAAARFFLLAKQHLRAACALPKKANKVRHG